MSPRQEGQPQSYDVARQELEKILNELQGEEVSVDKLSVNVRRAVELIKFCRAFLTKTEDEVKKALSEVGDPTAESAGAPAADEQDVSESKGEEDIPF